jgi:hypothetical protein
MTMPLKATHWGISGSSTLTRLNLAADVPFRSLKRTLKPKEDNSEEAGANALLQFALNKIEDASPRLSPQDGPTHPDYKGRGWWGPFGLVNTDIFQVGTYDEFTEKAVRVFQLQAMLVVDGIAGMQTLHRLDAVLVAVEKLPKIGPPPP